MGARFDNSTAFDDMDHIGVGNRRQSMCHHQCGPTSCRRVESLLDNALAHSVERRGRFIEQQHGRILEQHARDRDALLLAARQSVTALPHHGVVAIRKADNRVVNIGGPACTFKLVHRRLGLCVSQVLRDRRVEEVCLLGDDSDALHDRFLA